MRLNEEEREIKKEAKKGMNRTEQSYQGFFDKQRRRPLISSSELFVSYQCRSEFVAVTDGHERRRGEERRGKESKGNGRAGQDMTREEKIREDTRVESRH